MPELTPARRGAGPQLPGRDTGGRPDRAVPDQSRYGPPGTRSAPRYRGGRWYADPAFPGDGIPVWQPDVDAPAPPTSSLATDLGL